MDNLIGEALTAEFCNPTRQAAFRLRADGKLEFVSNGRCVAIGSTSNEMQLTRCEQGLVFSLLNQYLVLRDSLETPTPQCVSPVYPGDASLSQSLARRPIVRRGSPIALVTCNTELSLVELFPEEDFLENRKAMLLPSLDKERCDHPACGTNKLPEPTRLLPEDKTTLCEDLSECMTIVVKTARRPLLVANLAKSIRERIGYDIPIIVSDDGVGKYKNYSTEVWAELSKYPKLQYIIDDDGDLGIGAGRTKASRLVRTKYLMITDDDSLFVKETDLRGMVGMLDRTDASLIGGHSNPEIFAGDMEFGIRDGAPVLVHHHGWCLTPERTIEGYPDCYQCQIMDNFFVVRTRDVLEVGGWSPELKVQEHKDFFLRMKAGQKKVVFCPEFYIKNDHRYDAGDKFDNSHYLSLRHDHTRIRRMWRLFNNHWNIDTTYDVMPDITIGIWYSVGILLIVGIVFCIVRRGTVKFK